MSGPEPSPQRVAYIRANQPENVTAQEFVAALDFVARHLRFVQRANENEVIDNTLLGLLGYIASDDGDELEGSCRCPCSYCRTVHYDDSPLPGAANEGD
ncbi:MAG: hypothetical protein Q8Q14_04630 [Gemmatimonadales bacterium]|nr:hypothetical protein [Gemmatimonadales bacterium]